MVMNQKTITPLIQSLLPAAISDNSGTFPHCPNPSCDHYHTPPPHHHWYRPHNFYDTKTRGPQQRYQCKACKHTFSARTFSIDYYTKKTVDYRAILAALVTSTGSANICRLHGYRESLLLNRFGRLSRMLMAMASAIRAELAATFTEDRLVLDGFESFSHSQYHPNNVNLLVGSSFEYIYGMGLAILKRKGRMTAKQKETRERLERKNRTSPKETHRSVRNLLQDIILLFQERDSNATAPVKRFLLTDEHKTYPRSLAKADPDGQHFTHLQISSRRYRNHANPLFPVNYTDRQIRKDQANHVRETVQFARCPQAMMTRLTIYQAYHNFLEPYRIKHYRRGDTRTRAEHMGLSRERLTAIIRELWGRRPFRGKVALWQEELKTWNMKWRNPGVYFGTYVPKYISA